MVGRVIVEVAIYAALILVAGFASFEVLRYLARRARTHKRDIHEDTANRSSAQRMLADWLTSERVVRVMLKTGTASPVRLQMMLDGLGRYSEAQLMEFLRILLQQRAVRQAIAAHCQKTHGMPRRQTMRSLAELAGIKDAEEVA